MVLCGVYKGFIISTIVDLRERNMELMSIRAL